MLCLYNLHLSAYTSDGTIATEQLRMLLEEMQGEYDKGNYVIAGGDFNQTFSGTDTSMYPLQSEDLWMCGSLDEEVFSDNWQFAMDNSVPSCRSLDRPYDASDESFQYYMIDGFIVSDNLKIENIETIDEGFKYTDHNPVKLTVSFKDEQ